ncbi:hypothetical protein BH10PSE1_BH10PSE1_00820 [soil metagenome]
MPKSVQSAQSARVLIVSLTAVAATFALASPTLAQQTRPGEQMGLRYLSWAGRPAGDQAVAPQQIAAVRPAPSTAAPGRPNRYGAPAAYGLTPASAWISRRVAPTPEAAPADAQPYSAPSMPMPTRMASPPQMLPTARPPIPEQSPVQESASAPDYNVGWSFRRQDPYYSAPPQVQTAMQPTPQPTYMPPPVPIPTAVDPAAPPAGYDPMAPRADAPVFRMGAARQANQAQPDAAAQEQPTTDAEEAKFQAESQAAPRRLAQSAPVQAGDPPRGGARYYSVHREAGHEPDPLTLPESVFIGGGVTQDLAEPPPTPVTTRTVNGRAQVIVPNQDPTLP